MVLFIALLASFNAYASGHRPVPSSSFAELTSYFKLHGTNVAPSYKYNANSIFKVDPKLRKRMYDEYGDDFFVIEFFFHGNFESNIRQLIPAINRAIKIKNKYRNVIVRGYISAKSIEGAFGPLQQMLMDHPEYSSIRYLSPSPDIFSLEARARGVSSMPAMAITQGYGDKYGVLLVTDDFDKVLKKVMNIKLLSPISKKARVKK